MYRYLLPFLGLLLLLTPTFAQSIDWKTIDCPTLAYTQEAFDLTKIVNNSAIITIFNGETVDLTVFREGPPFRISGKVESGKIHSIQCGARLDSTLVVTVQQQALERIYAADDQVAEFIILRNLGAIRMDAKSIGSQIKIAIGDLTFTLYKVLGIKLFT